MIGQVSTALPGARGAAIAFVVMVAVAGGAAMLASAVQRTFGAVDVADVTLTDDLGRHISGKLYRPDGASAADRRPGILFVHGYES